MINISEILNIKSDNELDRSIDRKIRDLKLSLMRVQELTNEKIKFLNFTELEKKEGELVTFDANKLNGSCRRNYNNWIDALDDVHKMYIFENIQNISEIFNNPRNKDFPIVYEFNGEFYIGHDGKNRLTIAKCIKAKLPVYLIECFC